MALELWDHRHQVTIQRRHTTSSLVKLLHIWASQCTLMDMYIHKAFIHLSMGSPLQVSPLRYRLN
jgi:hypothetical protein